MNGFLIYAASAILNRALEFPVNLFVLKCVFLRKFSMPISSKKGYGILTSGGSVCVYSSFAIILKRKKELVALL